MLRQRVTIGVDSAGFLVFTADACRRIGFVWRLRYPAEQTVHRLEELILDNLPPGGKAARLNEPAVDPSQREAFAIARTGLPTSAA